MSAIFKIFDPLWALIGRHMFLTIGVFAIALGAAILVRQPFLILLMGMAVGTTLMLQGEAGRPEQPHVHLPTPSA
jgi:hypothetical protein